MRGGGGFTLVELLVAISILGLVAVVSAGLFHMGMQGWTRVSATSEGMANVAAVQSTLRRELTGAIPVVRPAAQSRQVEFEGKESFVLFHATLPQALGGGRALIRVSAEQEGELRNLNMKWKSRGASDWRKTVLLPQIQGARYQYFGSLGEGQPSAWHATWTRPDILPRAIKLVVDFPAQDGRIWPDLIVALFVTVDVTCIYDITSKKCFER